MQSFLLAHMNAAPGRTEEFDEWYTYVHTRDVMRMRGSIAVQRFALAERQPCPAMSAPFRFFTVYETAAADQLSQAHEDAAGTERMVMTRSADLGHVSVHYYYPVLFDDRAPAPAAAARHMLHLQASALDGDTDGLVAKAREALARLLDAPGFTRGWVVAYHPRDQMFRRPPAYPVLLMIHLADASVVSEALLLETGGLGRALRTATIYNAVTDRVTKDDVLHAGPEILAVEERVRARARLDPPPLWKPAKR